MTAATGRVVLVGSLTAEEVELLDLPACKATEAYVIAIVNAGDLCAAGVTACADVELAKPGRAANLERELQAWRDGALRLVRQGLTLAGPSTPAEFLAEVEAKLRAAAQDRRDLDARRSDSVDGWFPGP